MEDMTKMTLEMLEDMKAALEAERQAHLLRAKELIEICNRKESQERRERIFSRKKGESLELAEFDRLIALVSDELAKREAVSEDAGGIDEG